MTSSGYPEIYRTVAGGFGRIAKEIPGPFAGFRQLHANAVKDGALSKKHKELIALAIGVAVRCDGCVAFHVHDALKAGATRAEILETLGVVMLMGGGPAAVYAGEALAALDEFERDGLGQRSSPQRRGGPRRRLRAPRSQEPDGGMQMTGVNGRHEVRVRWMSAELGMCPRCGNARSVIRKRDEWGAYVDCLSCGWHGYEYLADGSDVGTGREDNHHEVAIPDARVSVAS